MKEYYTWEGCYYCVTRTKGGRIKQVIIVNQVRLELTSDFSEDYLNLCKPCTKAQFNRAGEKVVDKILKAVKD